VSFAWVTRRVFRVALPSLTVAAITVLALSEPIWFEARSPALHRAARDGDLSTLRALIRPKAVDAGCAPAGEQVRGVTALMVAARAGQVDAVELLLARGADPSLWDSNRRTAVFYALDGQHLQVLKPLINATTPAARSRPGGYTVLHEAAAYGLSEHCRALATLGLDVNAADDRGRTPLHYAAMNGGVDAVRVLLDHGANLAARTTVGVTPLHDAVWSGKPEVLVELLARGAAPDAKDHNGATALDWAQNARLSEEWSRRKAEVVAVLRRAAAK
jgi:ankyrin repeat protein